MFKLWCEWGINLVCFTDGFPLLYMKESSRDSRLDSLSEVIFKIIGSTSIPQHLFVLENIKSNAKIFLAYGIVLINLHNVRFVAKPALSPNFHSV